MAGNANSGRRRKSLAHHLAAGTYRADRHGPLPSKLDDSVPVVGPGEELVFEPFHDDAKEFYKAFIDSPVGAAIVATDTAALTLLSELWVLLNTAIDAAHKDPADASARAAVVGYMQQFNQLSSRFGLTPSDRERLRASGAIPAPEPAKIPRRDRSKDRFFK